MRISTSQINFRAVQAILEQQSQLSKTQIQIATGKKIVTPSDDPVGAAKILELNQTIKQTDQFQKNADAATSRLELEEGRLDSSLNILQNTRQLVIQASNTTLSDSDRLSIAVELRQNLEELLALANTKDNNNDYLFSGFQGNTRPFAYDSVTNTFTYSGDDGQRQVQISSSRQIADGDSGTEVFRAIRNGNGTFVINQGAANTGTAVIDPGTKVGAFISDTYTITFTEPTPGNFEYTVTDGAPVPAVVAGPIPYQDGATIDLSAFGIQTSINGTPAAGDTFVIAPSANQDIFQTVKNIIDTLETSASSPVTRSDLRNDLSRGLVSLDQGMENISNIRSGIGARLNNIDSQKDSNETFKLQTEIALSLIQDLDFAEATGRLKLQEVGLQAAQQSFVRIQGLTLFNFL